jgi:hypothetical protein
VSRVATSYPDPHSPETTGRVASAGGPERARLPRPLVALDAVLFQGDGWFAIDEANGRCKGVAVPSLEAGLALVGEGPVTSIVGRLRPEVKVVDVDLEGERGYAVAEAVTAWAARVGVWSLVRPSGGADGRCHVFVAPECHTDALTDLIEELRAGFRTTARWIDLRRTVRPLSAPHRTNSRTPRPYGSLTKALSELRARPWAASTSVPGPAADHRSGAEVALSPRRRRSGALPAPWSAYLRTGVHPPIGGQDRSRSSVEAIATGHLLRAGHTADSAWDAITAAHPDAMTKARANRRRWVRWVWNRAVQEDNAYRQAQAPRVDPDVAAAVAHARARLEDLQWRYPARQRPALLLVAHHVLDRMARTSSRRVPVPERDLVLDTGITDRKTIRTVLRELNGTVGLLDTGAWDPADPGSSFEFEIPEAETGGVRQIPPPSTHTPLPRGTWATLPRTCHALWRSLQNTVEAQACAELAQRAGITSSRNEEPTPSQVRTTHAALIALARAGLAHCTAEAQWVARTAPDADHAGRAAMVHAGIEAKITGERVDYRAGRVSPWSVARAAALKANRAREQAWWHGLERADQAQRRATWTTRYAALPVAGQEQLKAALAARRIAAGVDEPARHEHWLDAQSMDAYLERSVHREAWFAALPPPLQQAHAAAWARHRARFGISRGTVLAQSRREHADLLPSGRALRDAAFARAQSTLPGLGAERAG